MFDIDVGQGCGGGDWFWVMGLVAMVVGAVAVVIDFG